MPKKTNKTYFCSQVLTQFINDGCFGRAASLAYATLLSIVPLLTVSFSVFSAFPVFKGLAQKMQDFIFQNFVAASAQTVQSHLQEFMGQTAKLPVIGLLFLVVTAVFLVFTMEQAFNAIWRVKRRRADVPAFLIYWGVITFVPILVGIGLTVVASLFSLPLFSGLLYLQQGVNLLIPYFLTYCAFALLYITLPNCRVSFKSAFIGALPATILFELAKQAFALYIGNFPTYTLIYGALAAVPIFLVWLYVSWVIILFGVVVSYVFTQSQHV